MNTRNTLNAILGHQPAIDLVLHAGDLSYADCEQVRLPASSISDTLEPPPPPLLRYSYHFVSPKSQYTFT